MKIVIEIPEDAYRQIRNWGVPTDELRRKIYDIIDNGTPLPEHHGRLIDEQQIIDRFKPVEKFEYWRIGLDGLVNVLSDAPTIIEGSESE